MDHTLYMRRCLQLASQGLGRVSPNPLVGCVIVHNERVLAEGIHEQYGGPHAEVNAILSAPDPALLRSSTLYVNLEPCSHHGKTPPCSDLIISKGIPRVVIGTRDPFPAVNGQGIERLRAAGIQVEEGILQNEARELNRRFFTSVEQGRPYIILKWAETEDGYAGRNEEHGITWISGPRSRQWVHIWRQQEDAVLIGSRTLLHDNPQLTARTELPENTSHIRQPLRVVAGSLMPWPQDLHLFDGSAPTLVITNQAGEVRGAETEQVDHVSCQTILSALHRRKIRSVIVEGGPTLLKSFIDEGLWDEARVFVSSERWGSGLSAPAFTGIHKPISSSSIERDRLLIYRNV